MPTLKNGSRVEISYFNWIMGGPLLSVSSSNRSSNNSQTRDDEGTPASRSQGKEKRAGSVNVTGQHKNPGRGQDEKDADCEEKTPGKGGWTSEQDEKITGMKAENKSWKQIAMAVGASKKDVQRRYRELQQAEQGDGDDGCGGHAAGRDGSRGAEEVLGGLEGLAGIFDGGEGGAGNVVDGGGEEEKKKKMRNEGKAKGKWGGNEKRKEARGGKLTADDIWTRDDCEVLEMLEARYTEHKWLHLQAGFFNWTGRMVAGEIIEKKFRDNGAA